MTALHSCSRPFEEPVDLNDIARGDGLLFVRDGVGVAARGVARESKSNDIAAVLSSIVVAPGSLAPRAIGALPFAPGSTGTFVVPAVSVVKTASGAQHVVAVADDAPTAEALLTKAHDEITGATHPKPRPHAGRFSVGALTDVDTYLAAVTSARDAVRRGDITKAVIARDIEVTSGRIAFESVTFRYAGATQALYEDFSLVIPAGQRAVVQLEPGRHLADRAVRAHRVRDAQAGRARQVEARHAEIRRRRAQVAQAHAVLPRGGGEVGQRGESLAAFVHGKGDELLDHGVALFHLLGPVGAPGGLVFVGGKRGNHSSTLPSAMDFGKARSGPDRGNQRTRKYNCHKYNMIHIRRE